MVGFFEYIGIDWWVWGILIIVLAAYIFVLRQHMRLEKMNNVKVKKND